MNDVPLYEIVMWFPKVLWIAVTISVVLVLVTAFSFQDIKTGELNLQVLQESLYNSPAIMYEDEMTGRVYPGIVDISKFNSINLSKFINTERNDVYVKLSLFKNEKFLNNKYYVSNMDDTLQNFQKGDALVGYPERATTIEPYPKNRTVRIKNGSEFYEGELQFYMVKLK